MPDYIEKNNKVWFKKSFVNSELFVMLADELGYMTRVLSENESSTYRYEFNNGLSDF